MSSSHSSTKTKNSDKPCAEINHELCGVCQACAAVCPVNALEVLENYVQVISSRCTGCGVCVKVCPVGAIKLDAR